jgi:hypothetical protein
MHQIHSNFQSIVPPWKNQIAKPATQPVQTTNTQVMQVFTSQNVVLNLTTKEGDNVSISLAASTQSDFLKYQETRQDNEGGYVRQSQMYSSDSEKNFKMTVDGDLSEQERKDIGKVLKTIDNMMADFVQGHLEPAIEKAGKLSQLDTISGLSLDMSYTRNVLVAQQTEVQVGSDPLGTTYDSQGQLTETRPAIASQQPESTQPQSQVSAEADDVSTIVAKQLAQVQKFADSLLGAVKQIFDKYRQRVEKLNPDDGFGPSLIDRMHNDVLAKLSDEHIIQSQESPASVA